MFSRTKLLCTVPLGFSSRIYAANQSLFPHPVKSQDGYGVLKALRQNPALATIPFIFLTAKADKMDLRRGMELGANDYVTKPFTKNLGLKPRPSRTAFYFIANCSYKRDRISS